MGKSLSRIRGKALSATTDSERTRTTRALLVDDHDLFRDLLGVLLEQHLGFEKSLHAGSLAEARRLLDDRGSEVDLAVVDLDLPGENGGGFTLLEELRAASPGVPVVGVATSPDSGLRARALEAGASEVLATSATGEEVVTAARRLRG
jgi:DNA-binding NarL/FixJ family response regulator